jgi:uncharacterized protein (TIGR02453 family)
MMAAYSGFSPAAVEFYDQLQVHNTRSWWAEHKSTYEREIRDPMRELLDALSDEFGPARIFRPNRDVRFSKDKSPYKDHIGAIAQIEDAVGYYVQLSVRGLMTAGGWYSPLGAQTSRFRASVDSPAVAPLETGLAKLRRAKPPFSIEGSPLKTRPRGVPADHPRIELLRCTQLIATREYGTPQWLNTRKVIDVVRKDWRAMAPVVEWLADHVGPGADPADGD